MSCLKRPACPLILQHLVEIQLCMYMCTCACVYVLVCVLGMGKESGMIIAAAENDKAHHCIDAREETRPAPHCLPSPACLPAHSAFLPALPALSALPAPGNCPVDLALLRASSVSSLYPVTMQTGLPGLSSWALGAWLQLVSLLSLRK